MIKLNLQATTPEMEALKTYLEENASETLASKINSGVKIQKDGKTLINKKTLETFMEYAHDEAKKLVAKGARYACIKDDIVFGWAIHYFEDADIIGTLYNEDGTEYKKTVQKSTTKLVQLVPATVISSKTKPQNKQFSLFDLMDNTSKQELETPEEENPILNVDKETGEILSTQQEKKAVAFHQLSPLYQKYRNVQNQYPQAVIAYRVGDFFEVFSDNAVKIANHLDLTLTGRDCGLDERVPMVGFPYHASDTYFKKIAQFSPLIVVDNNEVIPYVLKEEIPIKQQNEGTMYENTDDIDDFEEERALQKFFDKDVLCTLYELFDYNLDMQ
jgi:hypothetical protein